MPLCQPPGCHTRVSQERAAPDTSMGTEKPPGKGWGSGCPAAPGTEPAWHHALDVWSVPLSISSKRGERSCLPRKPSRLLCSRHGQCKARCCQPGSSTQEKTWREGRPPSVLQQHGAATSSCPQRRTQTSPNATPAGKATHQRTLLRKTSLCSAKVSEA